MKKDLLYFKNKKHNRQRFSVLTAYDFATAQFEDEAGIDIILVGDSVGTNVLGYKSETEVTMADMQHHLKAVARGTKDAYLMVDMPYGSAVEPFSAYENARILLGCGADCVKVEGWADRKNVIAALATKGIDVCAHIGYNPQIHGAKATTFGKTALQAVELIKSAKILEDAGAAFMLIEKVPQEITAQIASILKIPVIGIGSGKKCDGQVLVVNDILGFGPKVFKHVRCFMEFRTLAADAITKYRIEVEKGSFPSEGNFVYLEDGVLEQVKKILF